MGSASWVGSLLGADNARKEEERKERRELDEIQSAINARRSEVLRKYVPRWFLFYQKFRTVIFLVAVLSIDFLLVFALSDRTKFSFATLILFLLIYPIVLVADGVLRYLALRKVPIEAYYQEDPRY
jgi:hypothetical protein